MTKILFITVGGSHQPIATSIKSQNPDRVVFICSDGAKGSKSQVIGEGKPCEVRKGTEVIESLPNIPTQLGLGDRFDAERDLVLIQEPDNLTECYSKINQKIREVKQESPRAEIAADYTGGTKTMSVALATAALDSEINLFITTSTTRQNLIKVESGERTSKATTPGVVVTKTVDKALPVYLQNYNYTAAIADLQNLLQSTELSSDQTRQIDELLDQCEGFDAWDRFDHRVALSRLQPYMRQTNIQPYGL
ncbi:MAG: TIGR02710 family CRISPR-associated CARF protein, partial [Pseudanabaena sp.]